MVKLRRDLTKLLTLCNLMKRREGAKKEIIEKDFKLIEARLQAEDYKNEALKKVEHQKAKEAKRLMQLQKQREVILIQFSTVVASIWFYIDF